MNKKNIIWIINQYSSPGSGAGRHAILSKHLTQQGYDVTIVCESKVFNQDKNLIEDKRKYLEIEDAGIKYLIIKNINYKGKIKRVLASIVFQFRVMLLASKKEKPDIVISSFAGLFGNKFLDFKKKYNSFFILEMLDLWPETFVDLGYITRNNPITKFLYRMEHRAYREADRIIFSFEGGKDYLVEHGWDIESGGDVDVSNIGYLNNGVDLDRVIWERENMRLEDDDLDTDKFKVVYLGTIRTANNIKAVVNAAEVLKSRRIDNVMLLIYGDGDKRQELEEYCRNENLDNIKFKGRLPIEYAPNMLSRCDVNLFSFENAPLIRFGISPNKLFMYLASGKPIISTISPNYDIVKKINCGIVTTDSALDIADAIDKFSRMESDEYNNYCDNCKRVANEYDYKQLVNVICDMLPPIRQENNNNGNFPLVSVIVVTYNQMNYLFETIDSILIQDYPNIELIICDDCSTTFDSDRILEYINLKKGANITNAIIHCNEENVGTVKNINSGIRISSGNYIKIIAGDDMFYDESVFSTQVDYLKQNKELLVTGKTQNCDEKMNPVKNRQIDKTNLVLKDFYKNDSKTMVALIRKRGICPFVTQACCFSRNFFDTYGLFCELYSLLEDSPTSRWLIRNEIPVGYCDIFSIKHRASVGVSANDVVFSKKRIKYYDDVITLINNEMLPYPELYPPVTTKYRLRTAKFRKDMCLAEERVAKVVLIIKNLDTISFYVISNPKEGIKKVKSVLKFGVK